MELTVKYNKNGEHELMEFASATLADIDINYAGVPEDERGGAAKQLLAASVLHCFCASFAKALDVRGAEYEKITGKATVSAGLDERKRSRITGIEIDVSVHMPEKYEDIFDRVTKVMRNGCLVSASLEPAIPMTYNMRHVCSGECSEDFACEEHFARYEPAASSLHQ